MHRERRHARSAKASGSGAEATVTKATKHTSTFGFSSELNTQDEAAFVTD
jgi:hypothetical protein